MNWDPGTGVEYKELDVTTIDRIRWMGERARRRRKCDGEAARCEQLMEVSRSQSLHFEFFSRGLLSSAPGAC